MANLSDKILSSLILVIRHAGERTFDVCRDLVLRQVPEKNVFVVQERPFEVALRKTYEIGSASGAKWMMTLDADVLLRGGAVRSFFENAQDLPRHYFQMEGLVYDKLMEGFRKAGHRMYRTEYLQVALDMIPEHGTEIRPESAVLEAMAERGFPSHESPDVYGVHDFEQFYRDIYRKAFIHANKHSYLLPDLEDRWKLLAPEDYDFHIALRGLSDGLKSVSDVKIDAGIYLDEAEKALADLGLSEKDPLLKGVLDFSDVEALIGKVSGSRVAYRFISKKSKRRPPKTEFEGLGALKTITNIFGRLFSRVGLRIKRLMAGGGT